MGDDIRDMINSLKGLVEKIATAAKEIMDELTENKEPEELGQDALLLMIGLAWRNKKYETLETLLEETARRSEDRLVDCAIEKGVFPEEWRRKSGNDTAEE